MSNENYETLDDKATENLSEMSVGTRKLGPYVLLSELGRGAMGTVYEVEHTNLKRRLALKILPEELAESPDRYARFQREMEAIGRLEHPNIVLATDAGQVDGVCFIAMQLVQGVDLSKVLTHRGQLPIGEACEVIRQVALGLQEINAHGMIHRDIKPSNLLLAANGEVKILDLGLAAIRQNPIADDSLTRTGCFLGTPDYVAPEQIISSGPIDIRADIYSLGCTLYHLIGGKPPFAGPEYNSFPAKLLGHAERQPEPLKVQSTAVPDEIVRIVDRMMAKDPLQRFAIPLEIAEALEPFCDATSLDLTAASYGESDRTRGKPLNSDAIRTATLPLESAQSSDRKWSGWIGVGLGVALLVAFFASWSALESIREDSRAQAELQSERLGKQNASDEKQLASTLRIEGDVDKIQAATSKIADESNQLNTTVRDMATDSQSIAENTGKIAGTLEQMRAEFSTALNRINEDPQSPTEWYANALIHAKSGNALEARRSYLKFFAFELNVIDPYQKFADSLRLLEGLASASETFAAIPGDSEIPARQLVAISLRPANQRTKLLQELVDKHPEFAPAYWALARSYEYEPLASLSLHTKFAQMKAWDAFLKGHENGQVLKYYLDQTVPAKDIDFATRTRKVAFAGVSEQVLENPVAVEFSYSGDEVRVWITLAEDGCKLAYRLESAKEFTTFPPPAPPTKAALSMLGGIIDPQLLKRALYVRGEDFDIPLPNASSFIEIKYVDVDGRAHGPFKFPFDANQMAIEDSLERARGENRDGKDSDGQSLHLEWVEFDRSLWENSPVEIWFTGLLHHSWRAVESMQYGINVEIPDRSWPIPKADYGDAPKEEFFLTAPDPVDFVTLRVTFVDGHTTEIYRYENTE